MIFKKILASYNERNWQAPIENAGEEAVIFEEREFRDVSWPGPSDILLSPPQGGRTAYNARFFLTTKHSRVHREAAEQTKGYKQHPSPG